MVFEWLSRYPYDVGMRSEIELYGWIKPLANWGGLFLLIVCICPSILKAWRTNRIFAGTLSGWGGLIAWTLIMCLIAPVVAVWLTGDKRVFFYFPEGPGVIAAAMTGWFSAGLISLLVQGLKQSWLLLKRLCRQ
jgi:hypothetical protein